MLGAAQTPSERALAWEQVDDDARVNSSFIRLLTANIGVANGRKGRASTSVHLVGRLVRQPIALDAQVTAPDATGGL